MLHQYRDMLKCCTKTDPFLLPPLLPLSLYPLKTSTFPYFFFFSSSSFWSFSSYPSCCDPFFSSASSSFATVAFSPISITCSFCSLPSPAHFALFLHLLILLSSLIKFSLVLMQTYILHNYSSLNLASPIALQHHHEYLSDPCIIKAIYRLLRN